MIVIVPQSFQALKRNVSGRTLHEAVKIAWPIADVEVLRVREVCQFAA